jgi:hypothetical protein
MASPTFSLSAYALDLLMELNSSVVRMQGMYALFASHEEMYLCKDDSFSWLSR